MSFLRGVVTPPQGASVQFLRALAQCVLLMITMAISLYMREVYSQCYVVSLAPRHHLRGGLVTFMGSGHETTSCLEKKGRAHKNGRLE